MRIVFDARTLQNPYSGLARYTFHLLIGLMKYDLANKNCKLEIILNKNSYINDSNHLYKSLELKVENYEWVKITYLNAPLFTVKHHWIVSQYVNKRKPDLYFYPHFDPPLFINVTTYFVIHDLLPLKVKNYLGTGLKWFKKGYFYQLINLNLRKTNTTCIAVSNNTFKDIYSTFKKIKNKIRVCYEASFLESEADYDLSIAQNLKDKIPSKYILYVGDRRPHKNLNFIIEVFSKMKHEHGYNGKLLIVGSKKSFGEDYDSFQEKLDVVELGIVSDPELNFLYQNTEALFFPSLYEGFGLPIVEAARFGKKIITSDMSSMKEIAPKWSLLINPKSNRIELIAETVAQYIEEYIEIDVDSYEINSRRWSDVAQEIFKETIKV